MNAGRVAKWVGSVALAAMVSLAQAEELKVGDSAVAVGAAAADSLTTHLALASGAHEANPLVSTSPAGLVGLFAVKWGLIELANRSDLPPAQKQRVNRVTTTLWGGAAANNLMLAVGSTGPLALVVGVVSGVILWNAGEPAPSSVPTAPEELSPSGDGAR